MVRDIGHGWAAPLSYSPKEGICGPRHVHMWGYPLSRNTWTGWSQHCLPKHLRERLKRHLT